MWKEVLQLPRLLERFSELAAATWRRRRRLIDGIWQCRLRVGDHREDGRLGLFARSLFSGRKAAA